jgi:hypothetical protein
MSDNISKLRAPFPADRIEWRIQSCGEKSDGSVWARCLAYIDNRAAMERLDEVYGEGWSHREEFKQIGNSAVCTVAITIAGGGEFQRTVTGSCEVELNKADDIDPFKSAASGAMKRAVVNLGIGRFLYELPEAWAIIHDGGKHQGKTKSGTKFRWDAPSIDGSTAQSMAQSYEEPAPRQAAPRQAAPVASAPAGDGDWRSVLIPFGKQQGKSLGSLPAASLKWWQDNYQPKPYKGSISPKDKAFRDALDASLGVTSAPATETPDDDVPF